jgi:hypothetical protein
LPAVIGAGLGALAIVTDVVTGWSRNVAAQPELPRIHIEFPVSTLIYPGGAIIVEVVYRQLRIPLLLWLISGVMLRGHHQDRVF